MSDVDNAALKLVEWQGSKTILLEREGIGKKTRSCLYIIKHNEKSLIEGRSTRKLMMGR